MIFQYLNRNIKFLYTVVDKPVIFKKTLLFWAMAHYILVFIGYSQIIDFQYIIQSNTGLHRVCQILKKITIGFLRPIRNIRKVVKLHIQNSYTM